MGEPSPRFGADAELSGDRALLAVGGHGDDLPAGARVARQAAHGDGHTGAVLRPVQLNTPFETVSLNFVLQIGALRPIADDIIAYSNPATAQFSTTAKLSTTAGAGAFVAKYDNAGTLLWVQKATGSSET